MGITAPPPKTRKGGWGVGGGGICPCPCPCLRACARARVRAILRRTWRLHGLLRDVVDDVLQLLLQRAADGTGVVLAKVWEKEQPEPADWTIKAETPLVHKQGSPGIFGFTPQNQQRVYIDNVSVTPNK